MIMVGQLKMSLMLIQTIELIRPLMLSLFLIPKETTNILKFGKVIHSCLIMKMKLNRFSKCSLENQSKVPELK